MSRQFKIKTSDIHDINQKLESGVQIKDIANEYDYYDGSALKKALSGLGFLISNTLINRRIK